MSEESTVRPGKRSRVELPIWLLGTGLAVGIVMVFLLLAVILANGVAVFWPRDVTLLQLREDSTAGPGGRTTFGAIILDTRAVENAAGSENELYLFLGSADVMGDKFHYLPVEEVESQSLPSTVYVAERTSRGDAIMEPLALILPSGKEVSAEAPDFSSRLNEALARNEGMRREIQHLERNEIASLNRQIELLRREGVSAGASPELQSQQHALENEHEQLARELQVLRHGLQAAHLRYRLLSGEEREQTLGEILRVYQPNALNTFEKLAIFGARFWRFLAEDPREGNTEGGIFPVIVGTFVLTLLMSVLVMPLGVVAAVYLREYARPGPIVHAVRIAVSNLAGVPSIVYGVFGLGFFVYFLGGTIDSLFFADKLPAPTFGTGGILWAALTLALLTVPVVIVATEESLAAFPKGMREASLACGASHWQTLRRVVLPASAPGMLTGLILAVARAAGEVAPLMLVGVVAFAPDLPFDGVVPWFHLDRKFMHMGYHIYSLGFLTPDSEAAMPMVYATTLLLILLVVVLNVGAILMRDYMRRRYTAETF